MKCPLCKEPALENRRLCKRHNQMQLEAQQKRRQKKLNLGLCTVSSCPNKPAPNRLVCPTHLLYNRSKTKRYKIRLEKRKFPTGLCFAGSCPNAREGKKRFCTNHLIVFRDNSKRSRRNKKERNYECVAVDSN